MKGDTKYVIAFLTPLLLITGVFLFYPFIRSIVLSFYNSDGFFNSKFIGFDNYIRLFNDQNLIKSMFNSFEMIIYTVVFQVGIALILAVMVNSIKVGRNFFRTTFFFPVVISGAAIALLFSLIYNYYNGMLNALLVELGFERVLWLTENKALYAVAVPTIWQYVGFYFVILFTAILKIPDEYYEAAKLEGISGIRKTFMITIPLIWSDIKVCLILAITGALKVFEMVFLITGGGPDYASEVLGTYMYKMAFTSRQFGYGATIAVLIVIIGVTLSIITNRLLKREEITY